MSTARPGAAAGGAGWWPDEKKYRRYLAAERALYAWCLARLGGVGSRAAAREARTRYPCEPPGTPYRGIVFHEVAWDWAHRRLYGDDSRRWPAADPAQRAEYQRESARRHRPADTGGKRRVRSTGKRARARTGPREGNRKRRRVRWHQ